jgi:hypothetical protein
MSLKKIPILHNVIEIYMHFIKNRKPRALTAYGPSDDFIPQTGVPQGGVESPLTWIFPYNISILMTSYMEN